MEHLWRQSHPSRKSATRSQKNAAKTESAAQARSKQDSQNRATQISAKRKNKRVTCGGARDGGRHQPPPAGRGQGSRPRQPGFDFEGLEHEVPRAWHRVPPQSRPPMMAEVRKPRGSCHLGRSCMRPGHRLRRGRTTTTPFPMGPAHAGSLPRRRRLRFEREQLDSSIHSAGLFICPEKGLATAAKASAPASNRPCTPYRRKFLASLHRLAPEMNACSKLGRHLLQFRIAQLLVERAP